MLFRLLLVVVVSVLSVACVHVKTDGPAIQELQVKALETVSNKPSGGPSNLTPELLYSILGGEIAGQRGHVGAASAFYLNAAKHSRNPEVALRAAKIALYSKDVAVAKAAADILIEDEELTIQARRLALTVYLQAAEVEKSLSQIKGIIEDADIPTRNALLAIGDLVSRHADKNTAIKVMAALIAGHTKEAGVYLARSQIYSKFSQFERAQQDANKAIELDPSWQAGYVQLAQVLERKGDTQAALVVLKEACDTLKTRQLAMVYGQLLAKDRQYLKAKEQFLMLANKEKDDPDARFALALVYLKLDDALSAKATFEALYQAKHFRSKVAYYLGRIALHQQKNEVALEWFDKVSRGENYVEARVAIAMIKAEAGDLPAARSIMQTLRNVFPKATVRFYLLEAELLMDVSRYETAYQLLTTAVNDNPSNAFLRYARSIAAVEVDQLTEAEKDLLYVIAKEPGNANALNALGYTLASKTYRFTEARGYLERALVLRPGDASILDSMGWLNYREGRYEQALLLLERAYKIIPDGEIAAHLGEVLWVLGRQREAAIIWREALKRDSGNQYLIDVVKRLK